MEAAAEPAGNHLKTQLDLRPNRPNPRILDPLPNATIDRHKPQKHVKEVERVGKLTLPAGEDDRRRLEDAVKKPGISSR